jgi:hypothetical protein
MHTHIKQNTPLRHTRHMRPRPRPIQIRQVLVIQLDRTGLGLVHPEELGDGGFAGAGPTDDEGGFVGGEEEGDVCEDGHGGVGRVSECDVVQSEFACAA